MAETGKIQTSFMEMGYMTFGKKGAKPFVILPGISVKPVLESAGFVEQAYRVIAEQYACFLIEPGMEVPDSVSIADMAESVKEALDELGLGEIILMGVSMGGMIAQELTLRYSETVEKLILCSTADCLPDSAAKTVGDWKELATERKGVELCLAFSEQVYTKEFACKYKEAFEALGKAVTEAEFERFRRLCGSVESFDTSERIGAVSCPVFVIGGKEDVIFPPDIQTGLAAKTKGDLFLYEGYAHAVYDEASDIKERILQWSLG